MELNFSLAGRQATKLSSVSLAIQLDMPHHIRTTHEIWAEFIL